MNKACYVDTITAMSCVIAGYGADIITSILNIWLPGMVMRVE